MDVNAIRTDLAQLGTSNGYEGREYVPESVTDFPAWIVGVPEVVEYTTSLGLARVELPITIAVGLNTFQDAQSWIDDALSTGVDGSAVDLLRALVTPTAHWVKVHVLTAGNVRFSDDADAKALAADITVEVFARK